MHTSRSNKPRIIITMGDPAGVGPEVTLKALASSRVKGLADFLLIGDGFVIKKAEKDLGLKLNAPFLDMANVPRRFFRYGKEAPEFGGAAIEYIDKALTILGLNEADGLVTAPVSKIAVKASGLSDFQGHTEYLAGKIGSKNYAMMFVGGSLKVTLVTRHLAIKEVPKAITEEAVCRAIDLTAKCLKNRFHIADPQIGVAGLNPHAGEQGAFGSEEKSVIAPAIKKSSKAFRGVRGPYPADTLFFDAVNKKFDAVVAMYHDQGLAPFKMLHFKDGVNVTLGLPFVRTSPDHGTAFGIAGKGAADPSSMIEAIRLACGLSYHVE